RAHGTYLKLLDPAVRIVDLRAPGEAASIPGLVRYLRCVRPAAALATPAYANVALVAARRLAGLGARLPTRVYLREASTPSQVEVSVFDLRGQLTELLRRRAYSSADGVVAVSEAAARDIEDFVGVPASRVHTIYNPVVDES